MCGLAMHVLHHILNRLGARSAAGAVVADGQKHPDVVDGHQVTLRQVDLRWYRTSSGRPSGSTGGLLCLSCKLRGPM
ncbi:DUF4262 domain-containing protein [Streptomyces sp. NPDC001928]|uniref:DUF4262 domain-containing protein n=1 Tax=Streptomyces sp. NPDC001928 TaxID=3154404 RepID=UPI00331AB4CD